ncbi:MAG: hypothetical protein U0586_00020 [Candidatus Brocadiaceae bacterium]
MNFYLDSSALVKLYIDEVGSDRIKEIVFSEKPLHVVCGKLEEDEILIITAYEPDYKEWKEDWKTRKKRV